MWAFILPKYGKFRSVSLGHLSINLLFLKSEIFRVTDREPEIGFSGTYPESAEKSVFFKDKSFWQKKTQKSLPSLEVSK